MSDSKSKEKTGSRSCLVTAVMIIFYLLAGYIILSIVSTLMLAPMLDMPDHPVDRYKSYNMTEEMKLQAEREERADRIFAYLQAGMVAVSFGSLVSAAVLMLGHRRDAGTAKSREQRWQWGDPDMIKRFSKRWHHEYYYEKRVEVTDND